MLAWRRMSAGLRWTQRRFREGMARASEASDEHAQRVRFVDQQQLGERDEGGGHLLHDLALMIEDER